MEKANFWKLVTGAGSTTSLKGKVTVDGVSVPVKVKLAEGIRPKATAEAAAAAAAAVSGTLKVEAAGVGGVEQSNSVKLEGGTDKSRALIGMMYGIIEAAAD